MVGNATDPLKNVGIVVLSEIKLAGDIVDVMRHGEVAEFDRSGPNNTAFASTAGTAYYAVTGTTGAIDTTAPVAGTNKARVGTTVEAARLIVDLQVIQG